MTAPNGKIAAQYADELLQELNRTKPWRNAAAESLRKLEERTTNDNPE